MSPKTSPRPRRKAATTGRKPKMTTARERRVLSALRLGATMKSAAAAAGVDESTLRRYRAATPRFAELVERAEQQREVVWLRAIEKAAAAGHWAAAAWKLERTNRAAFGRVTKLEGDAEHPIPVTVDVDLKSAERAFAKMVASLTTEEVRALAASGWPDDEAFGPFADVATIVRLIGVEPTKWEPHPWGERSSLLCDPPSAAAPKGVSGCVVIKANDGTATVTPCFKHARQLKDAGLRPGREAIVVPEETT